MTFPLGQWKMDPELAVVMMKMTKIISPDSRDKFGGVKKERMYVPSRGRRSR